MQSKVKLRKWLHHIALFSMESGVEAEPELESESVFSGRSRSLSRLKFVDSAALLFIVITFDVTETPQLCQSAVLAEKMS